MEVVVSGTVDSCLARVGSYFRQEWPHGGKFSRLGDRSGNALAGGPERIVLSAERRYLYNSWGGLAVLVGLSLVTYGAFLAIYFAYWIVVVFLQVVDPIPMIDTARVVATPEGRAQTKLRVTASRQDWQRTLESWVQKELVENQAAAVDPAKIVARAGPTPAAQPASTDIPEQIKQLVELRGTAVGAALAGLSFVVRWVISRYGRSRDRAGRAFAR